MRKERDLKRGLQIYIKDVRRVIFNKTAAAVIISSITVALMLKLMFPFFLEEGAGTELIISSVFKLMIIYYAVSHFGSDYFTKTARLIYSVQEERLVIFAFKLLANMTTALYFAAIHMLLRLSGLTGEITSAGELLTIPAVYLIFSTAVTVFSIVFSLAVKSGVAILIADYFLFFWTVGDNLAVLGQKISVGFLRPVFIHNTFYELGRSFAAMHIDQITMKSAIPFILFLGIAGALMLRRKDIS